MNNKLLNFFENEKEALNDRLNKGKGYNDDCVTFGQLDAINKITSLIDFVDEKDFTFTNNLIILKVIVKVERNHFFENCKYDDKYYFHGYLTMHDRIIDFLNKEERNE